MFIIFQKSLQSGSFLCYDICTCKTDSVQRPILHACVKKGIQHLQESRLNISARLFKHYKRFAQYDY